MPDCQSAPMPSPPVSGIPIIRRFLCALALLPIVPAAAILGTQAIADFAPSARTGNFDELRWFQLFFSILWVSGIIFVWRGVILWTLGRTGLTAVTAFIPFIQVVWAKPLWTAPGCRFISDELLMTGQHQLTIGFWVWIAIWIWWGLERKGIVNQRVGNSVCAGFSQLLIARLAACLGLFPVVFGIFLITNIFLEDYGLLAGPWPGVAALWISASVAVLAWTQIWRRVIRLNRQVMVRTFSSAAILMGIPLVVLTLLEGKVTLFAEATIWCMPIIGWGTWMAFTAFAWYFHAPPSDHETGPFCLRCAYSLRGLKATRCPECGDEPTLDELWTGRPLAQEKSAAVSSVTTALE